MFGRLIVEVFFEFLAREFAVKLHGIAKAKGLEEYWCDCAWKGRRQTLPISITDRGLMDVCPALAERFLVDLSAPDCFDRAATGFLGVFDIIGFDGERVGFDPRPYGG